MFREVLRIKQKLSEEECLEVLRHELRGVLSVQGDDGYPYGMPIDFWYCEEDGRIYFHGGSAGHKLDAIRRCDKVSFCVYENCGRRDGEWYLNFRSVIVFGRAEIIEDHERALDISRELSRRFIKDEDYIEDEVRKAGFRTVCFALTPEHISGKRVNEN